MGWWEGPLEYVFGIRAFTIARIGMVLQLLSGCYIVVDLLGEERIKAWSEAIQNLLATARKKITKGTRRTRLLATHIEKSVGIPLPRVNGIGGDETNLKMVDPSGKPIFGFFPYSSIGFAISLLLGGIFAGYVVIKSADAMQVSYFSGFMAATFTVAFLLIGVPGCFAGLVLAVYIMDLGLLCMEKALKLVTSAIVGFLRKRGLAYFALALSLVTFVLGSLFELAAS